MQSGRLISQFRDHCYALKGLNLRLEKLPFGNACFEKLFVLGKFSDIAGDVPVSFRPQPEPERE